MNINMIKNKSGCLRKGALGNNTSYLFIYLFGGLLWVHEEGFGTTPFW